MASFSLLRAIRLDTQGQVRARGAGRVPLAGGGQSFPLQWSTDCMRLTHTLEGNMFYLESTRDFHANLIFKNSFIEKLRMMFDQTSVYCGLCLSPGPNHGQGPLMAE